MRVRERLARVVCNFDHASAMVLHEDITEEHFPLTADLLLPSSFAGDSCYWRRSVGTFRVSRQLCSASRFDSIAYQATSGIRSLEAVPATPSSPPRTARLFRPSPASASLLGSLRNLRSSPTLDETTHPDDHRQLLKDSASDAKHGGRRSIEERVGGGLVLGKRGRRDQDLAPMLPDTTLWSGWSFPLSPSLPRSREGGSFNFGFDSVCVWHLFIGRVKKMMDIMRINPKTERKGVLHAGFLTRVDYAQEQTSHRTANGFYHLTQRVKVMRRNDMFG
ncbi:hypothetical protein B296_00021302 [Ensete ventricosum]|uniref:Uncharacterized protein n=1 Tax=Ensete ventricosum TaxID=4639 RepID=A0A426XXJ0_ENSVE|nr:hypothetical protein B296_00021302 [Ensete ventricosum]